jgi:RHS repeat-associated protein
VQNGVSYRGFGMLMPERSIASKDYRFSYQGHEKDDEVKGSGNSIDFGARIYDPRLGRFLSTDPREREYAWQSPYAYIRNNPINVIDFNGEGDPVENPKIRPTSGSLNKSRFMMVNRVNKNGTVRNHYGVDILAAKGTVLQTMTAGEVVEVVDNFKPGQYKENSFGNTVTIKTTDANGKVVYIKYAHLDKVAVKVGQTLKEGDAMGTAGNTGNAGDPDGDGPKPPTISPEENHVHIEASTTPTFKPSSGGVGTRVDPEQFMDTKFDSKGKPIEQKADEKVQTTGTTGGN